METLSISVTWGLATAFAVAVTRATLNLLLGRTRWAHWLTKKPLSCDLCMSWWFGLSAVGLGHVSVLEGLAAGLVSMVALQHLNQPPNFTEGFEMKASTDAESSTTPLP